MFNYNTIIMSSSTTTTNNTKKVEPIMDKINKDGAKIWDEQGIDAVINYMCTDSDGKPRSYADMRMMFG
jgi:hypothetical protein